MSNGSDRMSVVQNVAIGVLVIVLGGGIVGTVALTGRVAAVENEQENVRRTLDRIDSKLDQILKIQMDVLQ